MFFDISYTRSDEFPTETEHFWHRFQEDHILDNERDIQVREGSRPGNYGFTASAEVGFPLAVAVINSDWGEKYAASVTVDGIPLIQVLLERNTALEIAVKHAHITLGYARRLRRGDLWRKDVGSARKILKNAMSGK